MQKEEITMLQAGDEIDYRTKALTPRGLVDGGIETAQMVGTTQESALIKSRKFSDLTIAVQAHHAVAARRMVANDVIPIYTDIHVVCQD